ncbi:hypothetical protein MRX96_016251 [Rhipicephalus microplus]
MNTYRTAVSEASADAATSKRQSVSLRPARCRAAKGASACGCQRHAVAARSSATTSSSKRGATQRKEGTTSTGASALSPFAGARDSGRQGGTQNESAVKPLVGRDAPNEVAADKTTPLRLRPVARSPAAKRAAAQCKSPHAVA